MLVASRTDEEYFGIKVLLEFGQAVNTTVSKYIWGKNQSITSHMLSEIESIHITIAFWGLFFQTS